MGIEIIDLQYHRNGSGGEPFYAVTFNDPTNEDQNPFLATVFANELGDEMDVWDTRTPSGKYVNPRVAVISIALLPSVAFGHNSWRGDNYAAELYAAIREAE